MVDCLVSCLRVQYCYFHVGSWSVDNNLKTLEFAREKDVYCYFSAAAMLFPPELHEARISWAKHSILTAKVDDFFDNGGSMEELLNLIQLFKKYRFLSTLVIKFIFVGLIVIV